MKQIKTLSNSFALIETDGNGKVLTQFGFRKGGLSYFIKNNNVKFYLTEDFFYKNVVWSADAPLMIDGIPYDIDALPDALKKIFILEDEGGGGGITVDQTLSTASTNPIGNQAVAHAVNDLNEAVSDRYTKTETNSLLDNKLDVSAYTPTDLSQYWTSGETQSAITQSLSGYATEQWVNNKGYAYLSEVQALDRRKQGKLRFYEENTSPDIGKIEVNNNVIEVTPYGLYFQTNPYEPTNAYLNDSPILTEDTISDIINQYLESKADTSAVTAVDDALTAHTADTSVHVTSQEKTYWNNKLDASAYTPTDLSNYYTKGQTDGLLDGKLDVTAYTPTDLSNYYTKGETDGVVNGAVSGKADSSAVTQEISAAVSGLAPESAVTALDSILTAHTADTGIHVSQEEKDGWNAKLDASAYTPVDLSEYWTSAQTEVAISAATSGMPSSQTIEQMQGDITDLQNNKLDASAYTPTDLSNYYTSAQTEAAIEAATSGKADTSAVTQVNDALTAHTANTNVHVTTAQTAAWDAKLDSSALNDYWTSTQTENAISAATSGLAESSSVTAEISAAVSGKADTSAVTAVANDVQTVSGQVQTKVATSDFNTYTAATATALNGKADTSAVTQVNDALTAHTANTSVHVTSAEKTTWNNKSDFSGDYNDLTNKPTIPTVPTNISDFTNDAGYITNADITGKADTSAVTQVNDALTAHTANTNVHVTAAEKAEWDDKAEVVELTQAQYDALVTKDPDVLYVISDAAPAEVIISTTITSSSTNGEAASAKAVYDFVGGLKMVRITSADYQALATKDANTVYFVGDATNGYTMKLGEANIN